MPRDDSPSPPGPDPGPPPPLDPDRMPPEAGDTDDREAASAAATAAAETTAEERGAEPSRERTPQKQRGPVTLRRTQVHASTTDQRLLDTRGPADWVHTDPWRVLRIQSEFVEGFGLLAELPAAVSVFGSARTDPTDEDYQTGERLGGALARAGYAVITGGGPGCMEAVNKGAQQAGGVSAGLGIELPFEQHLNDWVDLGISFRYFFARKTMFVKYAQAFVVLPGGFGTMDELFEALTLVQSRKVTSFPVVLVGSDYWDGLLTWLRDVMLAEKRISPPDLDLIYVTDDVDEVVRVIERAEAERGETGSLDTATD